MALLRAAGLVLCVILASISVHGRRAAPRPPIAAGQQHQAQKAEDVPIIHIPVPLDIELFHLHSTGSAERNQNGPHDFALIGSLESPSWNGLHIVGHHRLATANGRSIRTYPTPLIFRVTASLHPPSLAEVDTSDLDAPRRVDDLLDHLRFVVRINHNLQQWQYPAKHVRSIGLPLSDAYPERTYEIIFRPARPIPFSYIICLDVYGPDGTRLAKFYLPDF